MTQTPRQEPRHEHARTPRLVTQDMPCQCQRGRKKDRASTPLWRPVDPVALRGVLEHALTLAHAERSPDNLAVEINQEGPHVLALVLTGELEAQRVGGTDLTDLKVNDDEREDPDLDQGLVSRVRPAPRPTRHYDRRLER